MRIPSPLILLSKALFEEAADERAHHSHQPPIKCIKGNVFGFMVCFEGTNGKMRWEGMKDTPAELAAFPASEICPLK